MSIFDTQREPVFLKDSSSIKEQLEQLKKMLDTAPALIKPQIEKDIRLLSYGEIGENNIAFELRNSHMPMYVIQDLCLERGDLTAQIDFFVVTRKIAFVIECKNLFGNIEITQSGDFIRSIQYGDIKHKEGIYSPVTQNQRHMDLLREIGAELKPNALMQTMFRKVFDDFFKSIIVLANPKTVLYSKYAPKSITKQVIRADQLISYIKQVHDASKEIASSDKDMEKQAMKYLAQHKPRLTDYTAKYQMKSEQELESAIYTTSINSQSCPKCGASLVKRNGKYGDFWGCSDFPKCRYILK